MTLDEAIKHLEDSLNDKTHDWGCEKCKREHEQLLCFLIELKECRSTNENSRKRLIQEQEKAEYWHDKYDHALHEQLKMEHELEKCGQKIQEQNEKILMMKGTILADRGIFNTFLKILKEGGDN